MHPEAFSLVNTQLKPFSSLPTIIMEVYGKGPSDYIEIELETYGWILISIEAPEARNSDRFVSDIEADVDHHSRYDEDDKDSYQIENDSDYWRRVAD